MKGMDKLVKKVEETVKSTEELRDRIERDIVGHSEILEEIEITIKELDSLHKRVKVSNDTLAKLQALL